MERKCLLFLLELIIDSFKCYLCVLYQNGVRQAKLAFASRCDISNNVQSCQGNLGRGPCIESGAD